MQTVEEYLHDLRGKGFQLQEDAIGFIYFGKHSTNAPDEIINTAIELTLKAQKGFDGSFYLSLLETLTANNIKTRNAALKYVKDKALLAIS
ncbi:DUF6123 family protein [Neobacillus sp. PS3-12]|uniref:DUF6123 family protein n=1 Tax=Neobacillus sp. PS3-12 TaxID=3070677 RepID=UPI0027E16069|nr:DUF6123 family protein [Neobacillus sp. PS3-12]WML53832.1 DUF6123 family protein [Neobacillus sp. PS3-12]